MRRKKKFQYTSSKRDMTGIYERMWNMRSEVDWPAVMICDALQGGAKVERHTTPHGLDIIYVANEGTDEDIFENLKDEVMFPYTEEYSTELHFDLTSGEIVKWYYLASRIASVLEIECPQIFFVSNLNNDGMKLEGASLTGSGLNFVCDYGIEQFYDMALSLAHELRHEWQFYKQPELLLEYVPGTENISAYYQHPSEVDAEAFARKFVDMIWGMDFSEDESMDNYEAVRQRQDEIGIDVDWCTTQILYELLDDEG